MPLKNINVCQNVKNIVTKLLKLTIGGKCSIYNDIQLCPFKISSKTSELHLTDVL